MAQGSTVFSKLGLCGMPDELVDYLHQQDVQRVGIVGIDTDMCVLKIAMDLFDMGIDPIVLTDCCASTAGLQAHLAGLASDGWTITSGSAHNNVKIWRVSPDKK